MSKVGRISLFQAFTSSGLGMRFFRGSDEPAEPQTAGQPAVRTGPRLQAPNRALITIAMADDALFFRGTLQSGGTRGRDR